MRVVYRVLAALVALEVVVQAAVIALASASLLHWVEEGGTLDKALLDSDDARFDGLTALVVHGVNGAVVVPLLALLLLGVSFVARVPSGTTWAALVFMLTVVQVILGLLSYTQPAAGGVHGATALLLFAAAAMAALRSREPSVVATQDREDPEQLDVDPDDRDREPEGGTP